MSELYIRLGKALKLERQAKNLGLAQLADLLKTSESTLERIEEGDFSGFSSPVYFTLYAKSYAEAIGVDYARTLDAIRDDLGETLDPVAMPTVSRPTAAVTSELPDTGRKRKPIWLFIIILLVVVALVAVWIFRYGKAEKATTPQESAKPATVVPEPIDTTIVEEPDSTAITLSLSARGSSWVALFTDGDTALYRTFSAGETLEVSAVRQMLLTVGTPSQVDLALNHHPVKLADRSGRISNVVITPANVRAYTGVTDSTAVQKVVDSATMPGSRESGR